MTHYCSICTRLLFSNEVRLRPIQGDPTLLRCNVCGFLPELSRDAQTIYCSDHQHTENINYVFSGNFTFQEGINYRELQVLFPITITSPVTPSQSQAQSFLGHYQLAGNIWTRHSYHFHQLLYSGSLGIPLQPAGTIDWQKVGRAFQHLAQTHPLLAVYAREDIARKILKAQVTVTHPFHDQKPEGWEQNFAFNPENVAPNAAYENLDDLLLGVDVNNQNVLYNRPGLMALTFPHLFPFCCGHYAFFRLTQEHRDTPKKQGGAPAANDVEGTLKSYAKGKFLMRDRRFGKDISFIFFLLDLIEKHNIHSANRRVIHTGQFGPVIRKRDIMDAATRDARQDLVSFIPHTIRSSQQYKQRQALNLQQMFKVFGTPQLFLTFSCDDFNQDFIHACSPTEIPDDNMRPCSDPVLFAAYFKRQWLAVFEQYVRSDAGLGGMVGGIREWSWVMEIQSRGSPHIHFVLWTGDRLFLIYLSLYSFLI